VPDASEVELGQGDDWSGAIAQGDPARDQWHTEALAVRCRLALLDLLALGAAGEPGERFQPLLAPGLRADAFGAGEADNALRGPRVVVQRGSAGELQAMDAAGFARQMAELLRDFEPDSLSVEVDLIGVETRADSDRTVAQVALAGRRGAQRLETRAIWHLDWVPSLAGTRPLLLALQRGQSQRANAPDGPLFEDITNAVLRHEQAFQGQLVPPLEPFARRLDAGLGLHLAGYHGLALADADGDELVDLYLPQPGGLPNKLLLQRADGTLHDVGHSHGADFLEASRSALFADWDGDGDSDLVVHLEPWLVWLENDGKAHFRPRWQARAPGTTSLAAADVDLDGDVDLYACASADPEESTHVPLPFYAAENGPPNRFFENGCEGEAWGFEERTFERGLDQGNRRYSMGASFEDFDGDRDQDLLVVNRFGPDNLYRNDAGSFRDVAEELGLADPGAGFGAAWADFDLDGRSDVLVGNTFSPAGLRTSFLPSFLGDAPADVRMRFRQSALGLCLFRQDGLGRFEELAAPAGLRCGGVAFGVVAADFDNDGRADVFVPNGWFSGARTADLASFYWRQVASRSPLPRRDGLGASYPEYERGWSDLARMLREGASLAGRERDALFLSAAPSEGRGVAFLDVRGVSGVDDGRADSRAAAALDWDRDGVLDLVMTSRSSPRVRLLRGRAGGERAWVAVRLEGQHKNRLALGARVELVRSDGVTLVQTRRAGHGFLAQDGPWLHFGLGDASGAPQVRVEWPDGARESFEGLAPGKRFVLVQGTGRAREASEPPPATALAAGEIERPAPAAHASTKLAVRLPLIELVGRDAQDQTLALLPPLGRARCLVLWSLEGGPGRDSLRALAEAASKLRGLDAELTALCTDEPAQRERAEAELQRLRWPFGRAWIEAPARQVLQTYARSASACAGSATAPTAYLVDQLGSLAILYFGALDPERLRSDVGNALRLSPERVRLAACAFDGRFLTPTPTYHLDELAQDCDRQGLPEAARSVRSLAGKLREASPAHLAFRMGLGRCEQGQFEEAVELLRQAIEVEPQHWAARETLATALLGLGKLSESVSVLDEILRMQGWRVDLRQRLSLALTLAGRDAEAEQHLEVLDLLDPPAAESVRARAPSLWFQRGQRRSREGDWAAAATDLRRAWEADSTLVEALAELGLCLRRLGQDAEATQHLRQALVLEPNRRDWRLELGLMLVESGDLESARLELAQLAQDWGPQADLLQAALQRAEARR
jgi:Flp pilus assembly protein TadD